MNLKLQAANDERQLATSQAPPPASLISCAAPPIDMQYISLSGEPHNALHSPSPASLNFHCYTALSSLDYGIGLLFYEFACNGRHPGGSLVEKQVLLNVVRINWY